ncbi:dihydrolipoamide acyltransferase [Babesia ovis]|uniref:Lipoamide acyltransferase component of branched-chain alpha-keto acid dehydrogenase complex, mitochondrial n=1 Tax=Babesia ovis TaxID=5869 RepID=A0A9W5WTJ9_BABOV|nr:dihydrolipoamide acyltransferase [Babesia ovis]
MPVIVCRPVARGFNVLGRGMSNVAVPDVVTNTTGIESKSQPASDDKGALEPKFDALSAPLDPGKLFIVKVPHIGNGITHGKIHEWHKQKGDHIDVGDLLCIIETDQVLVKVQSQFAGTVVETVGNEGCKVSVGADLTIIRRIEETEDDIENREQEEEE